MTDLVAPGVWDLYISCRDGQGRARVGRCRLTLDGTPSLSPLEPRPVIDLGSLGAFDDSGVTMSCLVTHGGAKHLYYTGWSLGVTVPFYLFIGVAVSHDGGKTFMRVSEAPVLARGPGDPYLTASPSIVIENGAWRMWYVSGSRWERHGAGVRHYYHIRYTESADGLGWQRPSRVAIDYGAPDEHAFGRPCVVRDVDAYRMWYCYRGERYRIGGATSLDGLTWERHDDNMGLVATGTGWERDMVAYPWIFDWQGRRYMLYNGNDYGRTGLGLALWEP